MVPPKPILYCKRIQSFYRNNTNSKVHQLRNEQYWKYWRDGSEVKRICCSSRRPGFSSWHPHGSQPFITPVSKELMVLFWPPTALGMHAVVHTYMQAKWVCAHTQAMGNLSTSNLRNNWIFKKVCDTPFRCRNQPFPIFHPYLPEAMQLFSIVFTMRCFSNLLRMTAIMILKSLQRSTIPTQVIWNT